MGSVEREDVAHDFKYFEEIPVSHEHDAQQSNEK